MKVIQVALKQNFIYTFIRYKTGNHIDAHETGFIKDINEKTPNGVLVQHGEYQYEAPDGQLVKVQYTGKLFANAKFNCIEFNSLENWHCFSLALCSVHSGKT